MPAPEVNSGTTESTHMSMSGLRTPRTRHFICGWLCLTQNRPAPIGTRRTEVGLLLQGALPCGSCRKGRTATLSTFSDAQFDEATFEAQLTGDRMSLTIVWYWILKLRTG